MLGVEAMMFQGWPISQLALHNLMTDALLQPLVGNAVACPVLLALMMSTFVAISWRDNNMAQSRQTSSQEDVDLALSLLGMLAE